MNMRLCYEAGAVLFWLLFAYLFMDKFLFRGQLGEICFGKARRRMAKALLGAASGSREKTGERASTCQGGNEAHRKDCGEKQ